jgi:hypothetical protein
MIITMILWYSFFTAFFFFFFYLAYLNDPFVQTALHVDGSYTTPIITKADDDLRVPGDDIVDTDMNSQEEQHYHGVLNHEKVILADRRVSSTDIDAHQWDVCNDAVNQHWAFNDYLSDTTSLYSTIYDHKNKPSNADDDCNYINLIVMMMMMMMIMIVVWILMMKMSIIDFNFYYLGNFQMLIYSGDVDGVSDGYKLNTSISISVHFLSSLKKLY